MRTPAFILAGLVAASLVACSSPTAEQEGCVPAGSASDGVTVEGDFGSKPTVEFSFPLSPEKTERTVDIAGKDSKVVVKPNDEISANFALYNGTTGEELTATEYTEGTEAFFTPNSLIEGLAKTITCSTVGSRVVGVIPAGEAWGANGSADLGVTGGQSIVFVVDILEIVPGVADGEPQEPVDGMPTVKLAEDGTPTITIPDAEPPTELQIAVLKKGDGAVVADGDTVKLQYLGINWNTNTVFDQSWGNAPVSFATNGVVAGFGQALVGQSVGSQVLVVIPPELGYGPSGGTEDGSIGATDTIVFVIDILGTTPAATE